MAYSGHQASRTIVRHAIEAHVAHALESRSSAFGQEHPIRFAPILFIKLG